MKRWHSIGVLIGIVCLSGCYDWRAGVMQAASLDHGCPSSRIAITGDDGHGSARVVALQVCGERRVYRDVNASTEFHVWVDTTTGGDIDAVTYEGARPDGRALVGSARSSDVASPVPSSDSEGLVRAHLNDRAEAVLACTGGASVAIEAGWDSSQPVVRFSPRYISDPAVVGCILAALGALDRPAESEEGHLVHAVAR